MCLCGGRNCDWNAILICSSDASDVKIGSRGRADGLDADAAAIVVVML